MGQEVFHTIWGPVTPESRKKSETTPSLSKDKCRSCGQPILWGKMTGTGATIPLDAEPDPDGNMVIVDGKVHINRGGMFEPIWTGPRYKAHFATCPHAKKHRRKR